MFYVIRNDKLTVKVSDKGAEVHSVSANGCEYIWQPEEGHWQRHAPWLFPICGGLTEGRYVYRGRTYEMQKHGFARDLTFSLDRASETSVQLTLTENEQTLSQYPFAFRLTVTYVLDRDRLICRATIANPGAGELIAGVGGHPGFRVPLDGGAYDDWYLSFERPGDVCEMTLADDLFWSGNCVPYPLTEGRKLPLSRALFAHDAKFFSGTGGAVTLKSDRSPRSVTVRYDGIPYVGVWSEPVDVGFVCIEPWQGLPAVSGKVDDLATKRDLFHVAPGDTRDFKMEMQFQ